MFRIIVIAGCAVFAGVALVIAAPSARAQIGNIFSDSPPRPPGSIPHGQVAPEDDEEEVPDLPQGRVLPAPMHPAPGQGAPPPGPVQSQPLPPPPGTTMVPQNAPGGVAVAPLSPPQTSDHNSARPAPPTPATLQPGDEVVTEAPAEKVINKKAVFSGLDKITGRIIHFDEDIGETVQFGALRVKTDACYTRPATEAANTDAFVEVDEITLQGEVKRIFSGWMFAASPGLHGVEHPIYDVWLTDCKDPETTVIAAQPDQPKPPPPARRSRQSTRQPRQAAPSAQPAPSPPPQRQPQSNPFFPPFQR
ncbi:MULTISPECIES: DUF2155 domain-containing protein [unclassified Nitrobacter]|uniref:DUF2155 domain-containing protein n=1 Tax=unclassified Nitrobacter TaxID=2620411 RepID=UPI0002F17EA2|nr:MULTISPECIES: DUF2155 domain-containing protein [unclassified Nitrobacter]MCB1392226.1 DUF2155 domain-containing protein [Nitrobacter sp.]MCV0386750.1 DUF2155 domain-containing protein [Nitrobacter sp.]